MRKIPRLTPCPIVTLPNIMTKNQSPFCSSCICMCPSQGSPYPTCRKTHATPQHFLSHIAIDFLSNFPESQGNTAVLVIVDWFSKSLHLVPLPGLSTTFKVSQRTLSVTKAHSSCPGSRRVFHGKAGSLTESSIGLQPTG